MILKMGDPQVIMGLLKWSNDLDDLGYAHDLGHLHLTSFNQVYDDLNHWVWELQEASYKTHMGKLSFYASVGV
jgi:hypothetical protein